MSIQIKYTDPHINEFSTDDIIVNVASGSLWFKSNTTLYKVQGDNLSTSITESGAGDDMWLRSGNDLYYTSGSVGIGTTTPGALLEIANPPTETPALIVGRNSGNPSIKANNEGHLIMDGNGEFAALNYYNNNDVILAYAGGNVGIGTISPLEKLHVEGNISASGKITAHEFHTNIISSSIIFESGSTIFGDSTDDTHTFTGHITASGNLVVDGFISASGNISTPGTVSASNFHLTSSGAVVVHQGASGDNLSKWEFTRNGTRKHVIYNDGRTNGGFGQDTLGFKHGINSDGNDHINMSFKQNDQTAYFHGVISASGKIITEGEITSSGDIVAVNSKLIAQGTDASAAIQLRDDLGNKIFAVQRVGASTNAHRAMLVLRDSATTKINMSSATGDISASGDMTCDNLGAGNSSPDAEISVGHDAANQRPIKIGKGAIPGSSATGGSMTSRGNNGGWANFMPYFIANNGNDKLGGLYGYGNTDTLYRMGIAYRYDEESGFHIESGSGTWNVGIGKTNPTTALDVNGTVTCTGFNNTSDINLKTNINNIETPLETISKLKGITFDWKDHIIETDKTLQGTKHGLIAQEVEKIIPSLVHSNKNKTVSYIEIIPILVEAIKEQQNQIDKLKRKINE